jgi:HK97 family phage prohead protease
MSAGHNADRDDVPEIDDAFYQRVKNLVDDCSVGRTHTILWLANRSINGRRVYIDEKVPNVLPRSGMNTGLTFPFHELGEWLGMDDGLIYGEAHRTRGNPCEKRRVLELGGDWDLYQDECAEYIRDNDREPISDVPADIDQRVYVGDPAAAAAVAAALEKGTHPMMQKVFASIEKDGAALGPRQARIVISDATLDRVNDIMVPEGCDSSDYEKNPIVLAQHDPEHPIGNATIETKAGRVVLLVDFAPEGISHKADEYCGLVKSGVIRAGSIGFEPVDAEPTPEGGVRYVKWKLMEASFVSVPANPNALVIARSAAAARAAKTKQHDWKVGASRNLPVDEDSSWDGDAAKAAIFKLAGFDTDKPDTALARKGFLAYNAANPGDKGSYKEPFATVKDGRLVAVGAGIRAAASRLPSTDIPDDVRKKARAVIDHYEGKMSDDGKRTPAARTKGKNGKLKIKGLYECAALARALMDLGFIHDNAQWEAEVEEDGSKLPDMLAGLMTDCAAALVAMTQEETAELLEGRGGIDVLPFDAPYVALGATPQSKAVRAAFCKARYVHKCGTEFGKANLAQLNALTKCFANMTDCHQKAADLHDDLHDQLVEWMGHGTSAAEHLKALFKMNTEEPSGGDADDDKDLDAILRKMRTAAASLQDDDPRTSGDAPDQQHDPDDCDPDDPNRTDADDDPNCDQPGKTAEQGDPGDLANRDDSDPDEDGQTHKPNNFDDLHNNADDDPEDLPIQRKPDEIDEPTDFDDVRVRKPADDEDDDDKPEGDLELAFEASQRKRMITVFELAR